MRLLLIIPIVIFLVNCSSDGNTEKSRNLLKEDVYLFTQQEVDDFGLLGYTAIEGWIYIGYSDQLNTSITDLSALNELQSVDGLLSIYGNQNLVSLAGLENLSYVARLEIFRNQSLTNLDALNNLLEVGSLSIGEHQSLTDIDGLSNLKSAYEIGIGDNDLVTNFDALSNITSLEGGIGFSDMESLTSITGLANLNGTIGNLSIFGNPQLTNIDALSNVTAISGESEGYGYLYIVGTSLTNLVGLRNITNISRDVNIESNYSLISMDLESLISIGGDLRITDCSIIDLDGFSSLTNVGGAVSIFDNGSLSNFCGLQNLINNGNFGDSYYVNGNSYNPSEIDIASGNCNQ